MLSLSHSLSSLSSSAFFFLFDLRGKVDVIYIKKKGKEEREEKKEKTEKNLRDEKHNGSRYVAKI